MIFPEDIGIGKQMEMLKEHALAVHNARGDLKAKTYNIAVQDLLLMMLHFGEGSTYNEALADACNTALRYRDQELRKGA
jgi:hypothetical protein